MEQRINLTGKLEGVTVTKKGNDAYISELDIDRFMAVTAGGYLKCMFTEAGEEGRAVRVYRVSVGEIDKSTGLFKRTKKWRYVGVVKENFDNFVVYDAFDKDGNLKGL